MSTYTVVTSAVGRYLLPMRLERLDDGRYIALNRYYKPIGTFSRDEVRYETSPGAFRFKAALTEHDARSMSFRGDANLEAIVLYDETCNPHASADNWLAYSGRLDHLMKLGVDLAG